MTNIEHWFYACFATILAVFFLVYWVAAAKQKKFMALAQRSLGLQETANANLKNILNELRRHSKLLAEIIDEAANSPAYDDESLEGVDEVDAVGEEMIEVSRKIYIGNLEYSTTESELADLFRSYGTIESVNIPINRYNGKARGFGFITFASEQEAEHAAVEMNGQEFKSRQLQVNFAKERD